MFCVRTWPEKGFLYSSTSSVCDSACVYLLENEWVREAGRKKHIHAYNCIFRFNGVVKALKIIIGNQEGWVRVEEQVLIASFLRVEPQCDFFCKHCLSFWVQHALIAHCCWQEETCKSKCHLETFGIRSKTGCNPCFCHTLLCCSRKK